MPKSSIEKYIDKYKIDIPVGKDMPDYSNCPTVIKRAEKASAFLKKHGLPKEVEERLKKIIFHWKS